MYLIVKRQINTFRRLIMNVKIKDLMKANVCSIKHNQTVGRAKRIFKNNNFNVLPVMKDDELVGIISQSDILLAESDFEQIHTFMKTKLVTISQYKNISDAAKLMKTHHIHHLIVTHEKQMIGIISTYDLLEVLHKRIYKYVDNNVVDDLAS